MAFGQQSGPPAGHRLIQSLSELLEEAGFSDFRDARGAMGFTQRQAGGKFSVGEAEEFIAQLETAQHEGTAIEADPVEKLSAEEVALRKAKTELLAAELQRRGWVVMEP
ncbi:hypothetical protein JYT71_00915 [Acidimicrobiaceae bacterium AH-315-P05]|nr:hypothetical protein [Acidimicrobiaceae bacterium AH-315-P05]